MSEEYEPIKGIANGSKGSSRGDSMLKAFLNMFSSGVKEREQDPNRPQSLANNDDSTQDNSSQSTGEDQQSAGADNKNETNSDNSSENGEQQSDQQAQSDQSEDGGQGADLNKGESGKKQAKTSAKSGEAQSKGEAKNGDSSKSAEESGGFFNPISNRLKIRKIRKKAKKDTRKDYYRKNHILRKHAGFMANREPGVRKAKEKFDEARWQRHGIYHKMLETKNLKGVETLDKQYEMKKDEIQTKAQLLKAQLLKADIKRVLEGPKGCLKDAGGCLKPTVICLLCLGGIITSILSLCGIF